MFVILHHPVLPRGEGNRIIPQYIKTNRLYRKHGFLPQLSPFFAKKRHFFANWADYEGSWADYEGSWADYEGSWSDYERSWSDYEGSWADYEGSWSDYEGSWSDYEGSWADYEGSWSTSIGVVIASIGVVIASIGLVVGSFGVIVRTGWKGLYDYQDTFLSLDSERVAVCIVSCLSCNLHNRVRTVEFIHKKSGEEHTLPLFCNLLIHIIILLWIIRIGFFHPISHTANTV